MFVKNDKNACIYSSVKRNGMLDKFSPWMRACVCVSVSSSVSFMHYSLRKCIYPRNGMIHNLLKTCAHYIKDNILPSSDAVECAFARSLSVLFNRWFPHKLFFQLCVHATDLRRKLMWVHEYNSQVLLQQRTHCAVHANAQRPSSNVIKFAPSTCSLAVAHSFGFIHTHFFLIDQIRWFIYVMRDSCCFFFKRVLHLVNLVILWLWFP